MKKTVENALGKTPKKETSKPKSTWDLVQKYKNTGKILDKKAVLK